MTGTASPSRNKALSNAYNGLVMADTLPLELLLLAVSGWVRRHQQDTIAYLVEKNRTLREKLGGKCTRLNDDQRQFQAAKAKWTFPAKKRVGRPSLMKSIAERNQARSGSTFVMEGVPPSGLITKNGRIVRLRPSCGRRVGRIDPIRCDMGEISVGRINRQHGVETAAPGGSPHGTGPCFGPVEQVRVRGDGDLGGP